MNLDRLDAAEIAEIIRELQAAIGNAEEGLLSDEDLEELEERAEYAFDLLGVNDDED